MLCATGHQRIQENGRLEGIPRNHLSEVIAAVKRVHPYSNPVCERLYILEFVLCRDKLSRVAVVAALANAWYLHEDFCFRMQVVPARWSMADERGSPHGS